MQNQERKEEVWFIFRHNDNNQHNENNNYLDQSCAFNTNCKVYLIHSSTNTTCKASSESNLKHMSTICNLQAIQEFEESLVTFLSQSKTLRPASMPGAFCCFSSNVLWVLLFVSLETDFSLSFPFPIISTSGKVYSTQVAGNQKKLKKK